MVSNIAEMKLFMFTIANQQQSISAVSPSSQDPFSGLWWRTFILWVFQYNLIQDDFFASFYESFYLYPLNFKVQKYK